MRGTGGSCTAAEETKERTSTLLYILREPSEWGKSEMLSVSTRR